MQKKEKRSGYARLIWASNRDINDTEAILGGSYNLKCLFSYRSFHLIPNVICPDKLCFSLENLCQAVIFRTEIINDQKTQAKNYPIKCGQVTFPLSQKTAWPHKINIQAKLIISAHSYNLIPRQQQYE